MISFEDRRNALLGGLAGLMGGFIYGLALSAMGMMDESAGLLGLTSIGAGYLAHIAVAGVAGAMFGVIFGFQADSYAATISYGILYGLLWWIVGPLTLSPILMGRGPTWSLIEAGHAYFNLIGHLLYGGFTGFGFYLLASLYIRWQPVEDIQEVEKPTLERVVILGGGFGGVAAAQLFEKVAAKNERIETVLVSQSNYQLFTPMLAEVASGSVEAQHISAPVRAACPNTRFIRAKVSTIDTLDQTVRVLVGEHSPPETIPYHHLILALGSVPVFYGLDGMEENTFALKTLEDAIGLRNHVISLLERADVEPDPVERARQLTFVVVGGGFAGMEMVAELFDLVNNVLRYYPGIRSGDARFILIHSRERVLPELSADLADYSLAKLKARGIEFYLNARVSSATGDAVQLQDGRAIPTYTIVWTAGNQPNPILKTLPCEHDRLGAVFTDSSMRVKGLDNVWAVGDCAQIPDAYHAGEFYPQTAQHALREGKIAAENILAVLQGEAPIPFKFRTIGLLVALGYRTGAAEIFGYQFSGLLAWLIWRGVYLSKLPGFEKKVRVAFDWLLDLVFPRDIVLTAGTADQIKSQPEARP